MRDRSTTQRVSVVIPCHDEADSIGAVVRGCLGVLNGTSEVLVVDDGSSDGTGAAAAEAGARVERLEPNRGKGVALLTGARAATGDILVFIDGDGQDDPRDLPALLAALEPAVDLVIGSRFLGTLHPGSIHPLNRLANRAFSGLISTLFGVRITDSQAGFRAMPRERFLSLGLDATEYEVETEMLLRGLRKGWAVREIPVGRHPRTGSATDFHRARHGLRILGTILRERLRS